MKRCITFFALLPLLLPGIAGAQSASGTTPTGLFYEATGSGEAVVLIHAFSVDRRMWDPQVALLAGRYRVIRYDLRGHGKSEPPATAYSPYEDLRSVLDAVSVKRATLVGLSAGSEVAIDFAIAYPDRVERVVLAAPGLSGYTVPPMPWLQPVLQAASAGEAERAAKLWVETPIMALRNDKTGASALAGIVMDNSRLWGFKTNPVRPLIPTAIKRLAEIKAPALVIVGDQDLPHIKEIAGLLVSGIAGARLVTIPGAGHIVNLDAPDAFDQAVNRFLQQ
jgi:3-oxoadipate enol-lactonase